MIERYEFTCSDCDPEVVAVNHGRYVRYSDHVAALAAARREALEEAAFRVCASAKIVDQHGNGALNYVVAPYLIDNLRRALSEQGGGER